MPKELHGNRSGRRGEAGTKDRERPIAVLCERLGKVGPEAPVAVRNALLEPDLKEWKRMRLLAMRDLLAGVKIMRVARSVHVNFRTIARWAWKFLDEGLDALLMNPPNRIFEHEESGRDAKWWAAETEALVRALRNPLLEDWRFRMFESVRRRIQTPVTMEVLAEYAGVSDIGTVGYWFRRFRAEGLAGLYKIRRRGSGVSVAGAADPGVGAACIPKADTDGDAVVAKRSAPGSGRVRIRSAFDALIKAAEVASLTDAIEDPRLTAKSRMRVLAVREHILNADTARGTAGRFRVRKGTLIHWTSLLRRHGVGSLIRYRDDADAVLDDKAAAPGALSRPSTSPQGGKRSPEATPPGSPPAALPAERPPETRACEALQPVREQSTADRIGWLIEAASVIFTESPAATAHAPGFGPSELPYFPRTSGPVPRAVARVSPFPVLSRIH